jgi:hypothetical protein
MYTFVFSLRNADVKATGKVGLSLSGDFFKTINYDILYKPIGSYLSVREFVFKFSDIYYISIFVFTITILHGTPPETI